MEDQNQLLGTLVADLRGVIIFSLDSEYRYTAFTNTHKIVMKTIWGTEIQLGASMLSYILREDDRLKAKRNFDRALAGELFIAEEEYGDESQHTRTWWEDRYFPVHGLNGEVSGVTVLVFDITHLKNIEHALRISEINYRSVMDQAGDGIFIADQSGRYLDVNLAGCAMLGYAREEIQQLNISDLIVPNPEKPLRLDEIVQGVSMVTECEMFHKEGRFIPVEINAKILEDGRLLGIVRDVAERKREEARIRYLAFVMDKISSAVIITDVNLQITHWNKGAEALYGWKEEEVIGHLVDDMCGTQFAVGQQLEAQKLLVADKVWQGEIIQQHRSGQAIWVYASVTLLEDGHGKFIGAVTINHDMTERKQAEEELLRTKESILDINRTLRRAFEREQLASRTDSLTGAFNRRYFFELLEYEFSASRRYSRPLTLVMFDIDLFKQINDTYGHLTGDTVLEKIVSVVKSQLRETDVLSRYGGDEFVILLSSSNEQDALTLLERIRNELIASPFEVTGTKLDLTISVGIASMHTSMEKSDQLVSLVDQALYAAKNAGRNRVFVYPGETQEH